MVVVGVVANVVGGAVGADVMVGAGVGGLAMRTAGLAVRKGGGGPEGWGAGNGRADWIGATRLP